MALNEKSFAVLLYGQQIGILRQKGDYTQFSFTEAYLTDPDRPILGLYFEENLRVPYASALRLPRWFSNLLPEGPLRAWIAADRHVALDREMELLAQVGHDLPGAVQVLGAGESPAELANHTVDEPRSPAAFDGGSPWRFSLAGVALKFSMLAQGDRLTVPAAGEHGDWLVKFPDYKFADVPRNEFTMMSLARAVGIDVPETRLIHRDELSDVPSRLWPNSEQWAYAIRRFDRLADEGRSTVHIEDFAQVRNKYPYAKYEGSFDTVAALAYRGRDLRALQESARRIAFNVLIGNGDAHLKNWSLIYLDRRIPTLSPVYDLVSTVQYGVDEDGPEDLGLKLGRGKQFDAVRLASFAELEARLDHRFGKTSAYLADTAAETARRVVDAWPACRETLAELPALRTGITDWIVARSASLTH